MALRLTVDGPLGPAAGGQDRAMTVETECRVGVLHERGGVRVRPVGDVDLASIGRLRERMNEAIAARPDRVVLDLRAATFLDSTGLHLAVDVARWATRTATEFVIIAGPPAVRLAFDAAGLSARLPFADGPRDASEPRRFHRPGVRRR